MCFYGFLLAGEIIAPSTSDYDPASHLCIGDVRVDNYTRPQFLEVHIKASKTDPFCQGIQVYLGTTSSPLCPVAAILYYMVRRGATPGPFFVLSDGNFITRKRFVHAVWEALLSAGLESTNYAGHSFQIGAAPLLLTKAYSTQ